MIVHIDIGETAAREGKKRGEGVGGVGGRVGRMRGNKDKKGGAAAAGGGRKERGRGGRRGWTIYMEFNHIHPTVPRNLDFAGEGSSLVEVERTRPGRPETWLHFEPSAPTAVHYRVSYNLAHVRCTLLYGA